MKLQAERLYQKILILTRKVRDDFRRKGMVIPVKNSDGNIRVGKYLITRTNSDFYSVIGVDGEIMAENLNLPQTAVVVANHLALRGYLNTDIVEKDREYGYAYFEHQVYQRARDRAEIDPDYFDLKASKYEFSSERAELYKQQILEQFNKLQKVA